ncbi:hypothetical protein GCM10011380_22200 [Sphingomonas metalli]|uniref:UrcA family protein n=1 Tax=Sphingomonas metalli TaxID=1779358 RepID=A0A916T6H8_9SPHN|nr:UrcA family protein [Sphingomonas metalli]GGB32341.1 hypothetical protein GCM10011380_22200 [Sphingomonas metalli]
MFTRSTTALAVALIASAPAIAAGERETVRTAVRYRDLDLSNAAGRATMQQRIDQAIRRACAARASDLAGLADSARCRSEMRRDAEVQLAAVRAKNTLVASTQR